MKCKYKFKINGKIKPSHIIPIKARGTIYEFEVNEFGVKQNWGQIMIKVSGKVDLCIPPLKKYAAKIAEQGAARDWQLVGDFSCRFTSLVAIDKVEK